MLNHRLFCLIFFAGVGASLPAFASFSSTTCSDSTGNVRYSHTMSWNTPERTVWTIKGTELAAERVVVKPLSEPAVLEQWNDSMTGGQFFAQKRRLQFSLEGVDQSLEVWLICRAAGGM